MPTNNAVCAPRTRAPRAAIGYDTAMSTSTLQRPPRGEGRVIAGVCAALADRFGLSRTLVRLLFVIFGLVGAGELAYIVAWIIIPSADR